MSTQVSVGEWKIPRYAVIPTNGRDVIHECLEAILPQVDYAIVVETTTMAIPAQAKVLPVWADKLGDINISKWWNQGRDLADWRARRLDAKIWDIAYLNDDAIVPENWFSAVSTKMREMNCAAASSGGPFPMPALYTKPGPVDLFARMQGFAFIMKGELGIKADERFSWYCSDDHMDWKAREHGGVVVIPGVPVDHRFPNGQVTPQIQVQIAQDMANFVEVWGMRPW